MKKQQIAFAFSLTNLWVLMIFFGAILFETLIIYPDIFHDVPRSLQTAKAFMVIRGSRPSVCLRCLQALDP